MSAELAILGLLVEQPLHGYGIERLIEARGMRKWTPIGFSSIYHILDQLVSAGLAEVRIEPAPGRGRERHIHAATVQGQELWERKTLAALSDVEGGPGKFLMALSGSPLLDQSDATAALADRVAALETRLADLERDLGAARPVPTHVEVMFDFTRNHLRSERAWVNCYLGDLTINDTQEGPP